MIKAIPHLMKSLNIGKKLVLIHRDEKYVSESDILLMKEDLLGVLQDSMEMKGNLKVWLKYIFWN